MSIVADGKIFYGILYEQDFEFPWDEKDLNLEDWWLQETGYDGSTDEYDTYYFNKKKWLEGHPLPVEEINYCSGMCPMYALCVPGSVKTASLGRPQDFNPITDFVMSLSEQDQYFEFISKYGLHKSAPSWYLGSYLE